MPARKEGSGKKKSYGSREVMAIKKAWKKNPKITFLQLLIKVPKTLGHLLKRTVLTQSQQERRLA